MSKKSPIGKIFALWLKELEQDDSFQLTGHFNRNAIRNERHFSLSLAQARHTTSNELAHFLMNAMTIVRDKFLRDLNVWVYAWHDIQTGHLIISVGVFEDGRLPFRCELEEASSPVTIAEDYLNSNYLDGISWCDLKEISVESILEEETTPFPPLPVYILKY